MVINGEYEWFPASGWAELRPPSSVTYRDECFFTPWSTAKPPSRRLSETYYDNRPFLPPTLSLNGTHRKFVHPLNTRWEILLDPYWTQILTAAETDAMQGRNPSLRPIANMKSGEVRTAPPRL